MADLNPTDEFLVNRNDATYTQQQDTLMANLQNDDYLLINRSDTTYKITGEDLIDSVIDPLELEVTLSDTTPAPGDVLNAIASASGGKQPYTPITYQWKKRLLGTVEDIAGETSSQLTVTVDLVEYELACECSVSDSLGKSVTTLSEYTDPVTYAEQVDTPELLTPQDGAGMGDELRAESGTITDVSIEEAGATMHGLRFDKDRSTYLQREFQSSSSVFSISFWTKTLNNPVGQFIVDARPDSGLTTNRFGIMMSGDNKVSIYQNNTQTKGSVIDPLKWNHIVVTSDGTTVKSYINGNPDLSNPLAISVSDQIFRIGGTLTESQFIGYLSDVYFVDGEALEPTAFGEDLDGTWAPLDSTEVLENIKSGSTKSPYETRDNMYEKWSDSIVHTGSGVGFNFAFDGNLTSTGANFRGAGGTQNADLLFTTPITGQVITYFAANGLQPVVNGITGEAASTSSYVGYTIDLGSPQEISQIHFDAAEGNGSDLAGIMIDGRVLVDGPADNSQNWSDIIVSDENQDPDKPYSNMFDGDETTEGGIDTAGSFIIPYTADVVPDTTGFKATLGSEQIFHLMNGDTEVDVITAPSGSKWWYFKNYTGPITGLKVTRLDAAPQIHAVKVNGKILVDSGAQWDTSQVWSDGGSGSNQSGYSWEKAFNGDLSSALSNGAMPVESTTLNWNGSIDTAGKAVTLYYWAQAYDSDTQNIFINNTGLTLDVSDGNSNVSVKTLDISAQSGNAITQMKIERSVGDNGAVAILGIKVDGKILVDSGNFGTNGFYLPFDPAATGADYSNGNVGVGPQTYGTNSGGGWNGVVGDFSGTGDPDKMFGAGSNSTATWIGSISYSTSFGIWGYKSDDDCTFKITINSTEYDVTSEVPLSVTGDPGGITTFSSIPSSGDITKIEIVSTQAGSGGKGITGFYADGELLVDHSSIGVDASGQGNHFQDENFAAGNTDEVWSDGTVIVNEGWRPAYQAFDGVISNNNNGATCVTDNTFNTASITFNDLPIAGKEVKVYLSRNIAQSSVQSLTIGDVTVDVSGQAPQGSSSYVLEDYAASVTSGTSIVVTFAQITGASTCYVCGIEVDGELLIDANIQDTVKDTPVKNYAVINAQNGSTAENGNLVYASPASTGGVSFASIQLPAGKFYWEVTPLDLSGAGEIGISNTNTEHLADQSLGINKWGWSMLSGGKKFHSGTQDVYSSTGYSVGDVVGVLWNSDEGELKYTINGVDQGVAFSGITGEIYPAVSNSGLAVSKMAINFGQQPFAASNVTHNLDAGTVEIDGETYDTLSEVLVGNSATLTISGAGTLGFIEGSPKMTAKVGGATGTYVSHTDTELVLTNTSGEWSTASETAISNTEYTIAAIDPKNFVMTSSAFSAQPLETQHGSSTWQVTKVDDTSYASPVIDVTSESALTTYSAGGLEAETTYRARVKHISTNDVESLWSEEIHENIFKTEAAVLDTPNATVSGLRFDPNRKTNLIRGSSGGIREYTFSCWIKPTNFPAFQRLFVIDLPVYSQVTLNGSGNVLYGNFNTFIGTSTSPLTLNKWNHLVVKVTSTEVYFYIDGADVSPGGITPVDQSGPGNLSFILGSDTGDSSYFDGYFSDVYFVDGHALEPTAFGGLFPQDPSAADRRWGPLDNAVVLQNINTYSPESPYENRSNTDEKWSDGASGPWSSGTVVNAFNGVLDYDNSPQYAAGGERVVFSGSIEVQESIAVNTFFAGTGNSSITVNGSNGTVVESFVPDVDPSNVFYEVPYTGTVTSITVNIAQSVARFVGLKIDGRLLVDNGVWDNSQNWSDHIIEPKGWYSNAYNQLKCFDGDKDTYGATNGSSTSGPITFTPPGGFDNISTIKLKYQGIVKFDGVEKARNGATDVEVTINDVTSFDTLTIARDGNNSANLFYVEINGKILVDSGAQWDTSQVWSDNASSSGGTDVWGSPTNAFDGKINQTSADQWGGPVDGFIQWTGYPAGTYNVRVWTARSTDNTTKIYTINSDGDDVNETNVNSQISTNGTFGWVDLGLVNDFTGIKIVAAVGSGYGSPLGAVEVDGKILVDQGSFGNNGFYLPFDPAQAGQVWSDYLTSSDGQYRNNNTPDKAFNGDGGSTFCEANLSGLDSLLTFEPPTNSFTGVLDVEVIGAKNAGQTVWVFDKDGNQYPLSDNENTWTATGIDGVAKIEARGVNNPAGYCDIRQIRIGGKVLVDSSSIGVDASGQGNHFYDQNFAVGNTSQVWSSLATGDFGNAASNAFDGDANSNTTASLDGTTDGVTEADFNFNPPITSGNLDALIRGYFGYSTHPNTAYLKVNGVDRTQAILGVDRSTANKLDVEKTWFNLTTADGSDITSVTISSGVTGGTQFDSTEIFSFRSNGELLLDGNSQDTVKDTPMRNYAVLANSNANVTTSNGNLHASISAGSSGAGGSVGFTFGTGTNYYAEVVADSLTATIGVCRLGTTNYPGNTDNGVGYTEGKIYDNGGIKPIGVTEIAIGDVIGIKADSDKTVTFYNNGVEVYTDTFTISDDPHTFGIGGLNGAGTINFGQQPFVASNVTHDIDAGTVEIDGETYQTLYQTWDQYATYGAFFYNEQTDEVIQAFTLKRRYGLLGAKPEAGIYALSVQPNFAVAAYVKEDNVYVPIENPEPRITAAEAQAAADVAAAKAETRKYQQMLIRAACGWVLGKAYIAGDIIIYNGHVFRALVDNTATADNDPGDLTNTWEYLGLEEDAAPLAIDGYFPLYETEEASNAAGNGSSHAHTIDGVTYYMPDAGVTIYHGDYTGFDY